MNNFIKNDGTIIISYGRSRREKKYKNKSIKWSQLLNRFKNTVRTNETIEEFCSFSKTNQDNIKDIGGFVGGFLVDGKRTKASLQYRSLITLDVDFGDESFLDKLKRLEFAHCIYSTHKHKIPNERYRLVIPLSKTVGADEYETICKKIAEDIGIDYFDKTSFQAERLMYWPSTCKDGEYIFKFCDKQWLNPDILNLENNESLDDFKDVLILNEEKVSIEELISNDSNDKNHSSSLKVNNDFKIYSELVGDSSKIRNPLLKEGIVGAFCRVYSIYDVIHKFLPNIYLKGDYEERYTYFESTTSNGFTVYEGGLFGYSYHNSDPCCNRLCNAFDLVRIHKFFNGDIDEKTSYKLMEDFAMKDEEVREELLKERLFNSRKDFSNLDNFIDENKDIYIKKYIDFDKVSNKREDRNKNHDNGWLKDLITKEGAYVSCLKNITTILQNDSNLKGKIAFNEFSKFTCIIGDLPWHKLENKDEGDIWTDCDDSYLRLYFEEIYGIVSPNKIYDGVAVVENENKYHPIKIYLERVVWDRVERLDRVFCDYLGADDSKFVRIVTRKSLVAAVARVFQPGIKYDYMPVLIGAQGVGKSQIIERLGKSWYSDSLTTVQGKEAYEQLQDAWIIEMAELSAIKKQEAEAIKHFISKSEDIFRVAYGKRTNKFPRQCVFFGTTNDEEFLKDRTGNRRFWPIAVGKNRKTKDIWTDLKEEEINQIWAEAVFRYNEGESLYLDKECEEESNLIQQKYLIDDSQEGLILEFLDMKVPSNWNSMNIDERKAFISNNDFRSDFEGGILRDRICAMEIWVELFNGDPKDINSRISKSINDIIRSSEDWEIYTKNTGKLRLKNYGVQKTFIRKELLIEDC